MHSSKALVPNSFLLLLVRHLLLVAMHLFLVASMHLGRGALHPLEADLEDPHALHLGRRSKEGLGVVLDRWIWMKSGCF